MSSIETESLLGQSQFFFLFLFTYLSIMLPILKETSIGQVLIFFSFEEFLVYHYFSKKQTFKAKILCHKQIMPLFPFEKICSINHKNVIFSNQLLKKL